MAWMPAPDPATRPLDDREQELVRAARATAHALYEGSVVPHHSCGQALAVTFELSPRPYQSLRRGGLSGERFCGSIRAGELILGDILGDPDPTGAVTDALRAATLWYQARIPERFDRGASPDYVCNHLTAQHGDFLGPARRSFCTGLTAEVAALAAESILRFAPEHELRIASIPSSPTQD